MGLIRLTTQRKFLIILVILIYALICLNIETWKSSNNNNVELSSPINRRSAENFETILRYLSQFSISLFLIDPFVLRHCFVHQLTFQDLHAPLITFGIPEESSVIINSLMSEKKFSFQFSTSRLPNGTMSFDHLFIEYHEHIVHLAILHPTNNYYLIKKTTIELSNSVHFFYGDTVRVIDETEWKIESNGNFYYPSNVTHFLWLYQTSKFLSCNQILADQMEKQYKLRQNENQWNLTIEPMRHIAQSLDHLEKHYWLAGGTLLGWYRHCGLIPFTSDVDFGLFAEEYDESIRKHFLGNPNVHLWGALGLVNDSLEFRLFTGRFTFDLFWAYREGDHRWCGYQVQRTKYRRTLPLLPELCSADLFGYRFSIPCSPVDYLNNEYGNNLWQYPLETNYTWTNTKYHSVWNDVAWMYAVRLYQPDGSLRTDQYAIDWIANSFDYVFLSIPSFLNIIPNQSITLPAKKSNVNNKQSLVKPK